MKFDPKVETILEGLILKAWESGIDLHVEPAFNDARGYNSCIVCNNETKKYGLVSTNVLEYPDDPIVFFSFNEKLYTYAKMEGFDTTEEIMEGFDNQVFVKETYKDFIKYLLG